MPLHQRGYVEFWLLKDLDLSDVAVLNRENGRRLALDLLSDGGRDELLHEGFEVSLGAEIAHDLGHLQADGTGLSRFGVARVLDLILLGLGEGNAEHTDNVSVSGSAVHVSLNDGLALLDERADLVAGHVHAVEVQEAVKALDVLNAKLDLAPGEGFVILEVSEAELDDTPL